MFLLGKLVFYCLALSNFPTNIRTTVDHSHLTPRNHCYIIQTDPFQAHVRNVKTRAGVSVFTHEKPTKYQNMFSPSARQGS